MLWQKMLKSTDTVSMVGEMIKCRGSFPSVTFVFTTLILRRERHVYVDDVVRQLPMENILLEMDSHYLKAPEHLSNRFNSPRSGEAEGLAKTSENVAYLLGLKELSNRLRNKIQCI